MAIDLLDDDLVRVPRATGSPNADLESYRSLREAVTPAAEPAAPPSGPCHVCHERPALLRCHQCGRGACREDAWTMLGLCRSCLPEEDVRAAREGTRRPRPDLDIKWIEE